MSAFHSYNIIQNDRLQYITVIADSSSPEQLFQTKTKNSEKME